MDHLRDPGGHVEHPRLYVRATLHNVAVLGVCNPERLHGALKLFLRA